MKKTAIYKEKGSHICFAVIVLLLAISPLLISSTSMVQFLGKCMCYSIVAIALDLIWGYTGMLSLGHGIYFCLGGYAMAMYLRLRDNGGKITDFMQTGGLSDLPTFWKPFESLPLAMIAIILVPGVLAGVIGFFVFRSRIKGVYFSIITQALTWAAYSLFIANSKYTGGNNGITDVSSLFGNTRGPANKSNLLLLFWVTLLVLIMVYVLAMFLVNRKFGKLLIAIRDGENRTFFSGYCVNNYKNFVYTLSAILAAIGGALFVNFNGSITPSQMTISYSITMVIWVAVGGRGTIIGAVIGAFFINMCEYNLSSGSLAVIWQYIIGIIFCVTIVFFQGGIVGIFKTQLPALIKRHSGKEEVA
ncbi:urea ABC transporter permease subunit UrtC [Hespellia stercorisuis]|uniref:Urea transport system permease protein n=1 Tax=Hespellia stercorisuis DSM 15480 TaxID=1121950 RepID=A0A1M6JZD4_9FIRM|nr:urea ABC transporter permease subunit UrtC [Hespellia stercorisuis]SHJ52069.1 urea transport system permease protein [Hespellia stercorisuis DSM 15480]